MVRNWLRIFWLRVQNSRCTTFSSGRTNFERKQILSGPKSYTKIKRTQISSGNKFRAYLNLTIKSIGQIFLADLKSRKCNFRAQTRLWTWNIDVFYHTILVANLSCFFFLLSLSLSLKTAVAARVVRWMFYEHLVGRTGLTESIVLRVSGTKVLAAIRSSSGTKTESSSSCEILTKLDKNVRFVYNRQKIPVQDLGFSVQVGLRDR